MISDDDTQGINELKVYLHKFQIKNLRLLRYFLGIEVAKSKKKIFLSQQKYLLDMLLEAGMFGYKSVDSLMDANSKLLLDHGEFLDDPGWYQDLWVTWNILQWLDLMLHKLLVWWVSSYLLHGQVNGMLCFKYFGIWIVLLAENSCILIVVVDV